MSNPYLKFGEELNGFSGTSTAKRNIVTTLSFNDDDIFIDSGLEKTVNDTGGSSSIFVDPIFKTEPNDASSENQKQNSVKHRPPFIDKETWINKENGLMFASSFSVFANGVMMPTTLIPNVPEFLNNAMKTKDEDSGDEQDGTKGAGLNNYIWEWGAWRINRLDDGSTEYAEEISVENFITDDETEDKIIYCHTDVKDTMTDIKIAPKTSSDLKQNQGISLEMSAIDSLNKKEIGTNGLFESGTLGSFMILMTLEQDQIIKGDDITKNPPWEVTIKTRNKGDTREDPNIKLQIIKNKTMEVSVFKNITSFNLPSPPVASSSQSTDEDPRTIAISFVPVFNGVLVSVGNWNGLDKKVSERMSKFCMCNPKINMQSFYDRNVDPNAGNSTGRTSGFGDSSEVGRSVEIKTKKDEDNSSKGLLSIGDILYIDVYNATGHISYIPLFFQTHSEATLYWPVESDISANSNVRYVIWPLWCANGMTAELKKDDATIADYSLEGVSATVASYGVSSTSDSYGIATATLVGTNPFIAGDNVSIDISGAGGGSKTLTFSSGNQVQWHTSNINVPTATVTDSKIELLSNRGGSMLKYKFTIQSGIRTVVNPLEYNDNSKVRYEAIINRFKSSSFPRYPISIYGATLVRQESIDLNDIHNDNKPFFNLDVLNPKTTTSSDHDWIKCITDANVSYTLDGVSGSINVDRYALNQIYGRPSNFGKQQIGQVTLEMTMGKSGIDNVGTDTNAYKIDSKNFFKGFAYGFGENQNSDSHILNVNLFGIDRKLKEMVLINSPYFDGETLERTVNFFCAWGNVDVDYSSADEENKLSTGASLSQVLHEFKAGTPLWDAIQESAEDTAHYALIQPDGKLYLYKIDEYGMPDSNFHTPTNWSYPNARIVNTSKNPDFSQFYNKIVVMGLQKGGSRSLVSKGIGNPLDDVSENLPFFPIAAGADFIESSSPYIPWEKIVFKPLFSYWTTEALEEYARKLAKQIMQIYYTGSTTIPGNLDIKLWDKFNDYFWITGISHNFSATNKSFTTDISLSTLESELNAPYDV